MAKPDVTTARLPLNDGHTIPQVGLGVWQAPRGEVTREAVLSALHQGYRHVDTAYVYGNELDVGWAVRESGVPRNEIFVTTKLWNDHQGYDAAKRAFEISLKRLGLDYVDLYLLHWPVHGKRLDSWEALEELQVEGLARSIGVSNFLVPHLQELLASSQRAPAVNQIELIPFLQRRDTVALCREQGIVVEAYSPLTHGQRLGHPSVAAVATEVARSPAQVLLRWGVQHGFVVLPKSTRATRIAENADLFGFELSSAQMALLDSLEEGLVTGWDPAKQD
jgi:diketogulonate reductase-like aldo/keto reductase